ncbi:MAG: hypothetical protein IJR94_04035 [Synergistaceae bacterium]|nr:hypothetical protein [Synergistaceae bacterium]
MFRAKLLAEVEGNNEVIGEVNKAIASEKVKLMGLKIFMVKNNLMRIKIEIDIKKPDQIPSIMEKIKEVPGVLGVIRG